MAELAQHFDVHPNQIVEWRKRLVEGSADVFERGGERAEPGPDLNALHAKIGQQALEIDFLDGSLSKAGLLSAKVSQDGKKSEA